MKWKRGSMDFFPEKTFLIIKDNVETFSVKKSYRRIKSKSAADTTGTWPPKVKKNSLFVAIERPKTANLERPTVLDPALVNKLDMSLLSKERLCDSMTRIQLDRRATTSIKVSGGGYTLPANNNKRIDQQQQQQQQQATSIVQSSNNSIVSLTEAKTFFIRSKRPTFQHLINNYYLYDQPTTTTTTTTTTTIMPVNHKLDPVMVKKSPSPVLNNNQTIKLTDSKITGTSLSTIRTSKSSRLALPEELKLFTATSTTVNKLKTPEPCKTCGRPDQPERFHSHPKGLPLKGITDNKDKNNNNNNTNDNVKKSIQKPVALNYKSDKNKEKSTKNNNNNKNGQDDCLVEIKDKKKLLSLNSSDNNENYNKLSRPGSVKKGPRTVTCYICSREFGTASFPIHEPKCMEKWERENEALSPLKRRPRPQRPELPLNHHQWNNVAWELSQTQLLPCSKCGRTFLPDRLPVHQKSCKNSKDTASDKSDRTEKSRSFTSQSGSSTIFCQTCGRNFGARTIKIHEPQCLKRWHQTANNISSDDNKKKQDKSSGSCSNSLRELMKPTTTCYICGRDFGSVSIDIHEPQCLKKWHIDNDKLPLSQRRSEPIKPILADTTLDTASPVINWAATTEAKWKSHLGQLVPCKNCKRTFNPDRVAVHERTCKGTR